MNGDNERDTCRDCKRDRGSRARYRRAVEARAEEWSLPAYANRHIGMYIADDSGRVTYGDRSILHDVPEVSWQTRRTRAAARARRILERLRRAK